MAITYPRALPNVKIASSRMGLSVNQSVFMSELSRKVSVQSIGSGTSDRWEGLWTTPDLSLADHAKMTAWLVSLKGQEKTFYAYDPDRTTTNGVAFGTFLSGTFTERSGTGEYFATYATSTPISRYGLAVGDSISAVGLLKSTAGVDSLLLQIIFYTINGTQISQTLSTGVTSSTYTSSTFTAVIPSGTHAFTFRARNITQSETAYAKDVALVKGASTIGISYASVNGASQTGTSLVTDGWTVSTTGLLLAGDYIQVGSQYYMVMENVSSDGSGNATINVQPAIRTSPSDNASVIFENPKMIARLIESASNWETDNRKTGAISFAWREVI